MIPEEQQKRTVKSSKERFNRDDEDGDGWTAVTPLDLRGITCVENNLVLFLDGIVWY